MEGNYGRPAVGVPKEYMASALPDSLKAETFQDVDDLTAGQRPDLGQSVTSICWIPTK